LSLAAGAIIIGFLTWVLWPKGPQQAIAQQLEAIENEASGAGHLPPVAAALKAKELAAFFTEDCTVDLPLFKASVTGNTSLQRTFSGLLISAHCKRLRFNDRSYAIAGNERSAEVVLSAHVEGQFGQSAVESYRSQFRVQWVREAGKWKIRQLVAMEP
jgi:hypothetical protein